MERINYNRGGNDGGNRGGRSTGSRGDNGRGGGGYHHGGRGRNNPQQYGNQHHEQQYQEQHHGGGRGRGRGRDSGGGGGGRGGYQTPRTPAYPVQNADRVPDRFDSGREVNSWSRVVNARPETLTQNPLVRQVQEVSSQLSSSLRVTEHSKDVVTANYLPIKRPNRGTLGMRSVNLLVNHFPIKFDPSSSIFRYDVDIKLDAEQAASSASRVVKKSIPKSSLRLIQEKLCLAYPDQFPLLQTGYDGEKNIFSAITLQQGTYRVEFGTRVYTVSVKFGTELNLSKLQDFLTGNAMHVPREVLQALDVAMKANLYRVKVSVGRGMYPRVHRPEDDLFRCGIAAYRGSQQSLKPTRNGLVLCTDYSVMSFRKRMPVLEFLKEHVKVQVNDIGRNWKPVLTALKGLKVGVTHRRTKQTYTVFDLSEKLTKDISFLQEDPEGKKEPETVMLVDYFRVKWDKEIVNKGIPCLNLGNDTHDKRPNYVPMELCVLAEDRRFPKEQLGKDAAKKLKELSLLAPDKRMGEIYNAVREEYATGHGADVIRNFGVEVMMNMTKVGGRVLEPPKLKLGSSSGKTVVVTVDKMKCHYNLLQGKTLVAGKSLDRWALIDLCGGHRNWLDVNNFIPKLMNRCTSLGVRMEEPLYVHHTNLRDLTFVDKVRRLLKWLVEECRKVDKGRLQMIICVMPDKHDGYKSLKLVSETEIGVVTQCCLSPNANKANDQFLANLGLKINAKLDGSNMQLLNPFPCFSKDDRFMFIGADVNHPAPSNKDSPSIAAVVGSVDRAGTRYAPRVRPQGHRKEEIVNFGSYCVDLVNTYEKVNGVKPNKIVVFRDGVSDDQFEMVLNKEMVDMKQALYTNDYRPFVTFVVAQKRHTTRIVLDNGNNRPVENMPPGTVVDTNIVHPSNFDFFLCSHYGGIGTSKATHYTAIWDEIGFSSDELQRMIYDLCYLFARCTKPVSLVTPVYYADLLAYRGRMFQEALMEMEVSGSAPPSCSFDQALYNLDQHLKDSMFFI